jgi:hypothetical protein
MALGVGQQLDRYNPEMGDEGRPGRISRPAQY